MREPKGHVYRLPKPDLRAVQEAEHAFARRETAEFERWSDYRRHRKVVEDEVMRRLLGDEPFPANVKASLAALRAASSKGVSFRDGVVKGPPVIETKPGLNIVGPPYDFGLNYTAGSNKPSIQIDLAAGRFAVVASAHGGTNSYGAAGNAVFVVPSNPAHSLAIRPYFEWRYSFDCHTHGTPTSHAKGTISCDLSGHTGSGTRPFPGHQTQLFSGSSDAWDDESAEDSGTVTGLDFQMVGSGEEYYVVSFGCTATVDSHDTGLGFSSSQTLLHCRVPFFFIDEF